MQEKLTVEYKLTHVCMPNMFYVTSLSLLIKIYTNVCSHGNYRPMVFIYSSDHQQNGGRFRRVLLASKEGIDGGVGSE